MFTNREEVLEKALRVFSKMNYEKATQMEIAKACGLSKTGLIYYFPLKQDLFVAVVDKYVFRTQQLENKFQFTASSFPEFIDQYVNGVENTMNRLVQMLDDGNNPNGCSFNFYYYHLLMQVRLYYPNVEKKLAAGLKIYNRTSGGKVQGPVIFDVGTQGTVCHPCVPNCSRQTYIHQI